MVGLPWAFPAAAYRPVTSLAVGVGTGSWTLAWGQPFFFPALWCDRVSQHLIHSIPLLSEKHPGIVRVSARQPC